MAQKKSTGKEKRKGVETTDPTLQDGWLESKCAQNPTSFLLLKNAFFNLMK